MRGPTTPRPGLFVFSCVLLLAPRLAAEPLPVVRKVSAQPLATEVRHISSALNVMLAAWLRARATSIIAGVRSMPTIIPCG